MLRKILPHLLCALGVAFWVASAVALPLEFTLGGDPAGAPAESLDALEPSRMVSVSMRMSAATYDPRGEKVSREVPEPETFLLMGSGLLGLGVFCQRRRTRIRF